MYFKLQQNYAKYGLYRSRAAFFPVADKSSYNALAWLSYKDYLYIHVYVKGLYCCPCKENVTISSMRRQTRFYLKVSC